LAAVIANRHRARAGLHVEVAVRTERVVHPHERDVSHVGVQRERRALLVGREVHVERERARLEHVPFA
jgi:hypothetical protein